jgi:hypothetical protein
VWSPAKLHRRRGRHECDDLSAFHGHILQPILRHTVPLISTEHGCEGFLLHTTFLESWDTLVQPKTSHSMQVAQFNIDSISVCQVYQKDQVSDSNFHASMLPEILSQQNHLCPRTEGNIKMNLGTTY